MASLVKSTHRNRDTNITEMEIDLEYGLKDNQESILIIHTIKKISNYIDVNVHLFPCIA